ncbi:hypothetical protein VYU27_006610 [Nannochloropsis oceanica]
MVAPAYRTSQKRRGLHTAQKSVPTTIPNTTSSGIYNKTYLTHCSRTTSLTMVPDCCLSYLDLMDLGRLLLTSHHLYKVAGAFISVLQADITRGQSLLHSPLPCFPPPSSLGVSPLPFLPSGFEWIDAVVMPPGTQNRRLLPVKRRKEEEAKGEEEEGEEEEEEEGEVGGGCNCGEPSNNSNSNSNSNSSSDCQQQCSDGGIPSCCQDASCPCFRRAHRISRHTTKRINDASNAPSRQPLSSSLLPLSTFEFECSARCRCPTKRCSLRPTQIRPPPVLQLRYTTGKGWGVFFTPPPSFLPSLPPDTFVAEYVGELIGTEEARHRLALYDKQMACSPSLAHSHAHANSAVVAAGTKDRGAEEQSRIQQQLRQPPKQEQHNYLLTLLEEGSCFLLRTSLDATQKGNVSRFFNHSCAPNLKIACVRDGGLLPRLCLFTSREVKVGEELTFAYGEGRSEGQRVCRCGARECQGFLPCYPGL